MTLVDADGSTYEGYVSPTNQSEGEAALAKALASEVESSRGIGCTSSRVRRGRNWTNRKRSSAEFWSTIATLLRIGLPNQQTPAAIPLLSTPAELAQLPNAVPREVLG